MFNVFFNITDPKTNTRFFPKMIYSKNDIPKRFGNAHMPVILAFGNVRHGTKRVKANKRTTGERACSDYDPNST